MRRIRRRLRRSRLLRRGRFAPYKAMYRFWSRRPVVPGRTLFLSDARADFSGNFAFLRDELLRQDPDADIRAVFKPSLKTPRPLRDIWQLPRLMASAQTIVLDDYYPIVYPLTIRPESRLLQVWHAAGAFKRVGWSRVGLPGGPVPTSPVHLNYTDATVSSEGVRADYAEAYGIDIAKVHALGVPRTDIFFDAEAIASASAMIRARYGVPESRRIALFAPTFRGDGQRSARFDFGSVDWQQLADSLGDEWTLMVKMHPFVAPLDESVPGLRGVIDVTRDREMTELMMAADVLITDYSSAIFEFSLLNRPIVFFCPDLLEYTASRDFYRPFGRYVVGPLVTDGDELATAIMTATATEVASAFHEEFLSACDGHSSERIVRELILRPRTRSSVPRAAAAPGGTPEPTRASGWMPARLALAWLARTTLAIAYAPLKLLPTQRKVVMISREHPTIPTDFADLREAIVRRDPTVTVVTLVRMVPPGVLGKLRYAVHMLRQLYEIATARVLILDTYAIVASVLQHKSDLTVIQMWHALGAFKKFGLSILDRAEGRDARLARAMRMHEGYDMVLASSERCRAAYAEAFGASPERVVVAPLPRVDRLRDPVRTAATRELILDAHPHLAGRRVAVFAPTFRLDGTVSVDVGVLAARLEAIGVHTVVKTHPLMQVQLPPDLDTGDGFSTQEMLTIADIFITDYSSALYEAALAGIPTYFLAPDLDEYLASRDFYLDFRRELPGPIVRSVDELTAAVAAHVATANDAVDFAQRWVEIPHDESATPCTDEIADIVIDAVSGIRRPVSSSAQSVG
ncbi:MAG: CDP-glycerol glycerophosphotransferase family protein [Microbacterium sp.]